MQTNKKFTLFFALIGVTVVLLCSLILLKNSWWDIVAIVPLIWSTYYLLAFVFSARYIQKKNEKVNLSAYNEDDVALIMTVCDDFNNDAANSLIKQVYRKYHVFILDDSKNEFNQNEVIAWCKKNSYKSTRLFRDNNKGFKAGNLNQAELKIPEEFQLFCIVDSDQHLHSSFIRNIFEKYCNCRRPSFVQGIHSGKTKNVSEFSKCLAPTIYAEWKYHIPYKNEFGQTGIGGHGFLIERKVLNEVGGHPEIVSEDLALTMNLSSNRSWGIMSPDITSMEIYPESYEAIQKRRFRWTTSDWEIINTNYFRNFLSSKAVMTEKFDLFLREIRLPVSSMYFAFIGFLILLSLFPDTFNTSGKLPTYYFLLVLFLSLSPMYPLLIDYKKHNVFTNFKAFFGNIFLGASFPSLQIAAGLYYLINRRSTFWVTNMNKTKVKVDKRLKISISIDIMVLLLLIAFSYLHNSLVTCVFSLALIFRLCFAFFDLKKIEGYIWLLGILFIAVIVIQIFFNGGLTSIELLLIVSLPFLLV